MASSTIRDLLKVIGQPGFISLAGGMPPPELSFAQIFPVMNAALGRLRHIDQTVTKYIH